MPTLRPQIAKGQHNCEQHVDTWRGCLSMSWQRCLLWAQARGRKGAGTWAVCLSPPCSGTRVYNSEGCSNSLCRPGPPGLHTSTTLVMQEGRTNFTPWCVSLSYNLGMFWFVTPGPLSVLCPRHCSCQERTDCCSGYWTGLRRPLALTALETATGMRTLLELISLMEGSLFSTGVLTDMVQKPNCTWHIDSQL